MIATNEIASRHRVDLDTTIKTLADTGKDMNAKYKETSEAGLAAEPGPLLRSNDVEATAGETVRRLERRRSLPRSWRWRPAGYERRASADAERGPCRFRNSPEEA